MTTDSDAFHAAVHAFIREVGGYWPPLGALARVLEEIGELAEAIRSGAAKAAADEAADVLTVVATLANQYCVSPAPAALRDGDGPALLAVLGHAGQLARAVNMFEGVKPLKPDETRQPLELVIGRLYGALATFETDPAGALVDRALGLIARKAVRDKGRFEARFDPICSAALPTFRALCGESAGPGFPLRRLWGGPDWRDGDDLEAYARSAQADLGRFVRISDVHDLQGFVVQAPPGGAQYGGARALLAALTREARLAAIRQSPAMVWTAAPAASVGGEVGAGPQFLVIPGRAALRGWGAGADPAGCEWITPDGR